MLYLIGLGLWDEKDISLKGLEACRNSDSVYAELYTAKWGGDLKSLSDMTGKDIRVLERGDMEEGSERIVKEAKERDVVVLVPGDPLAATTHHQLLLEAAKIGVKAEVIHSSSIYTAVSECGLGLYGFGRTVTLVSPSEGYRPTSYYDDIARNREQGLHTLVLLDIGMSAAEGLSLLLGIEKEKGKGIISRKSEIIAASKIGSEGQRIVFGSVEKAMKEELPPPAVIIIPGKIQFFEKEFLETKRV